MLFLPQKWQFLEFKNNKFKFWPFFDIQMKMFRIAGRHTVGLITPNGINPGLPVNQNFIAEISFLKSWIYLICTQIWHPWHYQCRGFRFNFKLDHILILLAQNRINLGLFKVSFHYSFSLPMAVSQNVIKTNLKKSRTYPIWCQSESFYCILWFVRQNDVTRYIIFIDNWEQSTGE